MINTSKPIGWMMAAIGISAMIAPAHAQNSSMDYGNDTGSFARDGECDDLRFDGNGMAEIVLTDDIGRDATDCSAAIAAGTVSLNPLFAQPASDTDIIFGDDSSNYARDGECDDIRFMHQGSRVTIYLAEDVGRDASDCKAGLEAGTHTWQGHRADLERGLTADELLEESGGLSRPAGELT